MKVISIFFLATVLAAAPPVRAGGDSSDGHSHGPAAAPVTTPMAPRAVAATEEFEVVAILDGKQLLVYVDRFATNAPVTQAKVEIDGAGLKGLARETAPGVYAMNITKPMSPNKYPLTIGIEVGDTADLLTAALDIPHADEAAEHAPWWRQWWIGMTAVLLILTVVAGWVARRRVSRRSI